MILSPVGRTLKFFLIVFALGGCLEKNFGEQTLIKPELQNKFISPVELSSTIVSVAKNGSKIAKSDLVLKIEAPLFPKPTKKETPNPNLQLKQLLGLNPFGLIELIGKPELRRKEPPAEVWQYSFPNCVLHIFLYRNSSEENLSVSYSEVTGRRKDHIAAEVSFRKECLGHLARLANLQNK